MEERITITLADGVKRPVVRGTKLREFADQDAIAAQIDGILVEPVKKR